MSELKVNKVTPRSGTTVTLGDSGDTITIPSGVTLSGFATNTPAFEAYLSANQTVSNDTATKIQFNTERFDTNSAYDNATNYRFTPQVAGKYFCYTNLTGAASSLTALEKIGVQFYLNGSVYGGFAQQDDRTNNGTKSSLTLTSVITFNGTTDYLEIFGLVDVGSGTSLVDADKTLFGAYKIIE
jgi:hypothetical protein